VITAIRAAAFVVADFTSAQETDDANGKAVKGGARGGVYFEAGFARGLGKQVIHTCRDDAPSRRRLHFDVEQISTIFWRASDAGASRLVTPRRIGLSEELTQRILATVGPGPVPCAAH
jgi:nucleoside 2-deoxyribosyltransferase